MFRIVQEALTNILRHAQATRVGVAMKEEDGMFILTVTDNGRGITPAEKLSRESLGLLGMQEQMCIRDRPRLPAACDMLFLHVVSHLPHCLSLGPGRCQPPG